MNNFLYDDYCKALYRFESGALITDSKGGNTLTAYNTPTANTTQFVEGAASLDLESTSSQYLTISDANLLSGFPCKNGETNKDFAICCWIRIESAAATTLIAGKYDDTATSFGLTLTTTPAVRMNFGYNSGASTENATHASTLSTATWYHITATYRNSDKGYALRIRDEDGNTVGTDYTGTATLDANKLSATAAGFWVGTRNNSLYFDGRIDELIVFNRFVRSAESTMLSLGTYSTNNFEDDDDCRALYRLDPNALTVDSKGSNTLTAYNSPVSEDSAFQEGAGSVDLEVNSIRYLAIDDADLDSGFPLKSDDTVKDFAVCCYFRVESNGERTILSKYDHGANKRTFHISYRDSGSSIYKVQAQLGYNGGASGEVIQHTSTLSITTWYHVTLTYSNSDKSYALRLRDTDGVAVGTDVTGTATLDTNKLYVDDAPFAIGAMFNNSTADQTFDGLIDGVVVFSRFITSDETTDIVQGTFNFDTEDVAPPAFSWRELNRGDFIELRALKELRDAADYLSDNAANNTHYVTDCSSNNTSDDSAKRDSNQTSPHYTGNDTSQRTADQTSPHYVGNDISQRTTNQTSPHYTGNDTSQRTADQSSPHYTGNDASHRTADQSSPYNVADDSSDRASNQTSPHYTGNDLSQRTSNQTSPHYTGNDTSQRTSNLTTPYNLGNDTSQRTSNLASPYYLGNDTSQRTSNLASPYYLSNDASNLTSYLASPYYVGNDAAYNSSVNSTANTGVHSKGAWDAPTRVIRERSGFVVYRWEDVIRLQPKDGKFGMWGFQANFHEGHKKCAEAAQHCNWVVGVLWNNISEGYEVSKRDIEALQKYSDVCMICCGDYHPENNHRSLIEAECKKFTEETGVNDPIALLSIGDRVVMHDVYGLKIHYQAQSVKDRFRVAGYADYVFKRWNIYIDLLEPVRDEIGNSVSKTVQCSGIKINKPFLLPEFETIEQVREYIKDIEGLSVVEFYKDNKWIHAKFSFGDKTFEEGLQWK